MPPVSDPWSSGIIERHEKICPLAFAPGLLFWLRHQDDTGKRQAQSGGRTAVANHCAGGCDWISNRARHAQSVGAKPSIILLHDAAVQIAAANADSEPGLAGFIENPWVVLCCSPRVSRRGGI